MVTIDTDVLNIQHDTKERRLFLTQKGKNIEDAYIEYELHTDANPTVVHFTSTYVPETIQDMGIGTRLAEEGMLFAEVNSYKVTSSCPFIQNYINQTPRFKKIYKR